MSWEWEIRCECCKDYMLEEDSLYSEITGGDHMMMWEDDEEETDTNLRNDTRDIAGKAF